MSSIGRSGTGKPAHLVRRVFLFRFRAPCPRKSAFSCFKEFEKPSCLGRREASTAERCRCDLTDVSRGKIHFMKRSLEFGDRRTTEAAPLQSNPVESDDLV